MKQAINRILTAVAGGGLVLAGTAAVWAATPTFSPTTTFTASPTLTASLTPTGTFTVTPTGTQSVTPTATPSFTVTATVTPTFTVSGTATPTGTFTPTGTISVTATQTPSRTPSATASPTASISATPTLSPIVSQTSTATVYLPPAATPTVTVTLSSTAIPAPGHQASSASPVVIRQNVVRPSQNQSLHVELWLDAPQRVTVRIYTQGGRLVKVLEDRVADAGKFETAWAGVNQNGSVVGSGVYFIEIQTDRFREKRKLVVVR